VNHQAAARTVRPVIAAALLLVGMMWAAAERADHLGHSHQ
jgi:hypothetical protein